MSVVRRTYISAISAIALLVSVATAIQAQQQHTITTVAGGIPNNITALQVGVGTPARVFKDSAGNLYISTMVVGDEGLYGNVVYKVDPSGQLTTVAGNGTEGFSGDGGPATNAALSGPQGVYIDSAGNIFIADSLNDRIREVDAATGIIHTVAGNGNFGFSGDGGPATSAELHSPSGVFGDSAGNIFIADSGNERIREVVAATGIIHTVAGNGNFGFSGDGGPAPDAELVTPSGVFVDISGNIFIADTGNARIREVVAATGIIQTVAGNGTNGGGGDGGPATSAQLNGPFDVAVDGSGNVFIADSGNQRIREVVASTGTIQTVAGNGAQGFSGDGGPATSASLRNPFGLSVDGSGNIFIADRDNNRIRKVVAATGNIQTVAGNGTFGYSGDGGPATSATINVPSDVYADSAGNLFVADSFNNRIRKVVAATGDIQTVAGNGIADFSGDGGLAASAALHSPEGVFVDGAGNIFIADHSNGRIREVVAATGNIQTVAGNGTFNFSGDGGPATSAGLVQSNGVFVDSSANIFLPDNSRIREVVGTTGIIQTVAGNGTYGSSGDGGPATSAELYLPLGVYVDGFGNIFIADSNNSRIREVVAATGTIRTVAGNGTSGFSGDGGPATGAQLAGPKGVYVDSAGNLFIADTYNSRIREVEASTGIIRTVAGNGAFGFSGDGGPATSAELDLLVGFSNGITGDRQGNLFIAEESNSRIRRISGLAAVVGISVGPSTATVSPSATQQFNANVTNAINTAVTWSLSGTGCTGNGCGTISPQGLYTAPSATGSPLTVTVTATSVADNSKSATATVTVPAKQASTVAVSSSANPSVFGQAVTLTATVSPSSSSSVPTGTVTFSDGANTLGTVPLNSSGSATLTASSLAVAAHPITATYSGDSGFLASNGSLTENVSYGICPLYDQTRAVTSGATFPIKLYLCDAGGNDVSSAAVALHATQITIASGYSGSMSLPGSANPSGNFRFNAWLGPAGGYIFNLNTAGLPPGTYSLQFTAGSDPVPHAVNFVVR